MDSPPVDCPSNGSPRASRWRWRHLRPRPRMRRCRRSAWTGSRACPYSSNVPGPMPPGRVSAASDLCSHGGTRGQGRCLIPRYGCWRSAHGDREARRRRGEAAAMSMVEEQARIVSIDGEGIWIEAPTVCLRAALSERLGMGCRQLLSRAVRSSSPAPDRAPAALLPVSFAWVSMSERSCRRRFASMRCRWPASSLARRLRRISCGGDAGAALAAFVGLARPLWRAFLGGAQGLEAPLILGRLGVGAEETQGPSPFLIEPPWQAYSTPARVTTAHWRNHDQRSPRSHSCTSSGPRAAAVGAGRPSQRRALFPISLNRRRAVCRCRQHLDGLSRGPGGGACLPHESRELPEFFRYFFRGQPDVGVNASVVRSAPVSSCR